jgi:MFS family permease
VTTNGRSHCLPACPAGRPSSLGGRYWRLWTATSTSSLGDGLEVSALPLLAASLSTDPQLVAGVATAATLPWLVFTLLAGVIVDRQDRRVLMWRTSLWRAGVAAVVAVLVAVHHMALPVLYVLVFALGAGQTLFDSASQAILPDLVKQEQLPRANSRRQVGEMAGMTFIGPALGGVLFATLAPAPFTADAAAIVIALALVASIRGSYSSRQVASPGADAVDPANAATGRMTAAALVGTDAASNPAGAAASLASATTNPARIPARTEPRGRSSSITSDIGEGMRWLFHHRVLRSLALVLSLANLAIYMTEGILVLFAIKDLALSKQGYGLLLTSVAVGGLLGGAAGARISEMLRPARTILLTVAVIATCYLAVGFLSQALAVAVVTACAGFATSVWNVVTISLRQELIPRHLMGRVNSAYRLIGMGSIPIGTLLGGAVAHAFGLRFPFFAASFLLLVSAAGAYGIKERNIAAARLTAREAKQYATR